MLFVDDHHEIGKLLAGKYVAVRNANPAAGNTRHLFFAKPEDDKRVALGAGEPSGRAVSKCGKLRYNVGALDAGHRSAADFSSLIVSKAICKTCFWLARSDVMRWLWSADARKLIERAWPTEGMGHFRDMHLDMVRAELARAGVAAEAGRI